MVKDAMVRIHIIEILLFILFPNSTGLITSVNHV